MIENEIYKKISKLKSEGIKTYINNEFNFNFDSLLDKEIIIFGINNSIAKEFIQKQKYFNIVVIVDDFYNEKSFNNISIVKSYNIENYKNNHAINLTFSSSAFVFFNELALSNNIKMFNYYEITQYFDFDSAYPYFNDMLVNTLLNFNKYIEVLNYFSDNLSKSIIFKHLSYRLMFNHNNFIDVQENFENQYFDININNNEVFIDGGCFDGQTSLILLKKDIKIKKIYCFEPDYVNLQKVKKSLEDYTNIKILDCGLWDKKEEKYFLSTSDEISRVVEKSDNKILLDTIDNLASDATFIKLDVEGAEEKSIIGAIHTIKKKSPKLAISIYHKPNDLFEIINLVNSINPKYKFYIRHYSDFLFDTILYGEVK